MRMGVAPLLDRVARPFVLDQLKIFAAIDLLDTKKHSPPRVLCCPQRLIVLGRSTPRGLAAGNMVVMKNFGFMPMALTVPAGMTVTWKNLDGEPHTVVSTDGLSRSKALDENDTFAFKFDKPGTYKYLCSIHPRMVGTITVK